MADVLRQIPESSPIDLDGVDGDFAYLTMAFSTDEATLDAIVTTAHRHGLICRDPQTEGLA